jgi:hypothetical protein
MMNPISAKAKLSEAWNLSAWENKSIINNKVGSQAGLSAWENKSIIYNKVGSQVGNELSASKSRELSDSGQQTQNMKLSQYHKCVYSIHLSFKFSSFSLIVISSY